MFTHTQTLCGYNLRQKNRNVLKSILCMEGRAQHISSVLMNHISYTLALWKQECAFVWWQVYTYSNSGNLTVPTWACAATHTSARLHSAHFSMSCALLTVHVKAFCWLNGFRKIALWFSIEQKSTVFTERQENTAVWYTVRIQTHTHLRLHSINVTWKI